MCASKKKGAERDKKPQIENASVKPTHKTHDRPNANSTGHGENMVCDSSMLQGGKGETRGGKANELICNPHHPRYICIGVETKYVTKEAEGTTHKKTNNATTTSFTNHANMHIPRPYVPMSIATSTPKRNRTWRRSPAQDEKEGAWYGKQKERYGKSRKHHGMTKKTGRREEV